jgi:DNA-binding response OmpR family regulator
VDEPEKLMSVLVVSQDEAVIEDARYGLPPGFELRTARDARDAQTVLKDFTPSVVIVDQMTGNAGGYALARDMRATNALKEVPILILLERDQDAWLAKQAGANLFRTKPISSEILVADTLSLLN